MDEANNLSVIFSSTDAEASATGGVRVPPLPYASTSQQLREWIRNCNARIATIRDQIRDGEAESPDLRKALLDLFPANLHFPMGALIDFANRLGRFENLELASRVGLETQSITSAILYLQQLMRKRLDSGIAHTETPKAYCRAESESTWTCLRELVLQCSRKQRYDLTLESAERTQLPVPTLDLRLIIQNVIFSVLNGGVSSEPIAIHVTNQEVRPGQNFFSLAIQVPGNPLGKVVATTLYNAVRQNHTFVFEGSGIGHILAAKLLDFLGGEIVITNNCDGTQTVNILVPLDSRKSRDDARAAEAAKHNAHSDFSVLYIEDMKSHALLVKQIFDRLSNIDLQLEATAWAGLAHAQTQQTDLILLDMELPDMKGLDLFRRLRQDPRTAGIPVVAISASAMPHQVQEALDLGMCKYITKPFSYKELIRVLQEEQGKKQSSGELN
jgi:CheY-like chemotaxis protein